MKKIILILFILISSIILIGCEFPNYSVRIIETAQLNNIETSQIYSGYKITGRFYTENKGIYNTDRFNSTEGVYLAVRVNDKIIDTTLYNCSIITIDYLSGEYIQLTIISQEDITVNKIEIVAYLRNK